MKIYKYETIDSTNSEAKRLIQQGYEPNFAVFSKQQTKGRGRYARVWQTPAGNLAITMVVKPSLHTAKQSSISLVTGLAIYDVLAPYLAHTSQQVSIKWPNDILINGAKISGTLIEADREAVYIGVGINVATKPTEISYATCALNDFVSVGAEEVAENLTESMLKYHYIWETEGFQSLLSLYNSRLYNFGQTIRFAVDRDKKDWITGKCHGINTSGELLIEDENGRIVAYTTGDVDIPK